MKAKIEVFWLFSVKTKIACKKSSEIEMKNVKINNKKKPIIKQHTNNKMQKNTYKIKLNK